jgi:enterochelin esterase family protein
MGEVYEDSIASPRLSGGQPRRIWVYKTPGALDHPNLLVLLDGTTYMKSVPTTRILDNLYGAGEITATVVVFVADGNGDAWRTDLYFSDDFVAFLADELLPWVQAKYGFVAHPTQTAVGGESIAGLTAAFAAFRRPRVFTKVLSQSASFWLNNRDVNNGEPEWLTRQVLDSPSSNITYWIDVGTMEFVPNEADRDFSPFVPGTTSLLAANRHLRDVLRAKCNLVFYSETNGGHEPLRWTRTLPQGILALFGRDGAGLADRSSPLPPIHGCTR